LTSPAKAYRKHREVSEEVKKGYTGPCCGSPGFIPEKYHVDLASTLLGAIFKDRILRIESEGISRAPLYLFLLGHKIFVQCQGRPHSLLPVRKVFLNSWTPISPLFAI
jgi:hypothetical protein